MTNLFLDTNVIIDFLATREPFSLNAAILFELAEKKKVNLFVSAVSFNTIYYILRQKFGHKATLEVLDELSLLVSTLSVTGKIIKEALISGNTDFEDAIQYYTALSDTRIEVIVTRDVTGFKKSQLRVLRPDEITKFLPAI